MFLNPKRGSFDGDPKDWSFWKGDQIIVATIKDKDFLRACVEGIYRLNGSDLLTVDLLEKQRIIGTQVLKPSYEITRVIEYKKGDYQPVLSIWLNFLGSDPCVKCNTSVRRLHSLTPGRAAAPTMSVMAMFRQLSHSKSVAPYSVAISLDCWLAPHCG